MQSAPPLGIHLWEGSGMAGAGHEGCKAGVLSKACAGKWS